MTPFVELERHDGVPVARLAGEVDLTRAVDIRTELLGAMSNQDYGLVLDLRDATYLDSAGVNVIFEVAERLTARQQKLISVVPDRALIERVISLVNLRSVMQTVGSLEEAVAAVQALAPSPETGT